MPREAGPERAHFGGENGLITEIANGKPRYFWRCMHCNHEIGGKVFPNARARIHLSGDPDLRNGMVSQVCQQAPEEIKTQFALLHRTKLMAAENKAKKRKRAKELMRSKFASANGVNSPAKQQKLQFMPKMLHDDDVDDAWGRAFFGLDIATHKVQNDLFKEAIECTKMSSSK